jgi:hypothetical protein
MVPSTSASSSLPPAAEVFDVVVALIMIKSVVA